MVTDTKTEQVNSFLGGMNTDTSDYLLDPKLYREAHNLRFITDKDSDSGDFRLIEGGVVIDNEIEGQIIASTSIRDYGILIVVKDEYVEPIGTLTGWSVVLLNKDGSKKDTPFGPCYTKIWNNSPSDANLSLTTRYESDTNIKLYIADGIHKLMSLNIIREDKNSDAPYDINVLTGSLGGLLYVPTVTINPNGGQLTGGIILYGYLLYEKYGNSTKLSPISTPQFIYNIYNGVGVNDGKKTGCSTNITVKKMESNNYGYIKIFRISYENEDSLPIVNIIYDGKFDHNADFVVTDTGNNISTITIGEFNLISGIDIIPKTISQKNNMLFCGNIKYDDSLYANDWKRGYPSGYEQYNNECYCKRYQNVEWTIITSKNIIDTDTDESHIGFTNTFVKNLMRGETYRYGVIFYDSNGNNSSVKYIDDIKIPMQLKYDNKNKFPDDIGDLRIVKLDGGVIKSNNVGIRFKITLPADCAAYEIVRCERTMLDSETIAQGAISYTAKPVNPDNTLYDGNSQMPMIVSGKSYIGDLYLRESLNKREYCSKYDASLILFISPDVTYSSNKILDVLKENLCYIEYGWALSNTFKREIKYSVYQDSIPDGSENYTPSITWLRDITLRSISTNGFYPHTIESDGTITFGCADKWSYYTPYSLYPTGTTPIPTSYLLHDMYDKQHLYAYHISNSDGNNSQWTGDDNANYHYHDNYAYIKYNVSADRNACPNDKYYIKRYSKANDETWDNIIKEEALLFTNNISIVGNKQYINFTVGAWLNTTVDNAPAYAYLNSENLRGSSIDNLWESGTLIGLGGTSLLFNFDEQQAAKLQRQNENYEYPTEDTIPLKIYNLKKEVNPYGGTSENAINNSIFYGHGEYTETADNIHYDSSTNTKTSTKEVFDGDTFIQMYEHVHVHKWHSLWDCGPTMSIIYAFPVETRINLNITHGTRFSNIHDLRYSSWIQKEPCTIVAGDSASGGNVVNYTQEDPMYLYNHAYSMDMTAIKYAILSEDELKNTDYDCRIVYSNISEQNETIDKFKIFQSANYIDVDTRYGAITELQSFKNGLFFWQENAFGALSVNEKQLIQNPDDTTLMLGTGDVLQRYDYVTTEYGMNPNEFIDTQGNNYLYWFDHNRRELLQYSIGGQIQPLSKEKGLTTYMRNVSVNDKPSITFDNKYDEVLLSTDNEIMVYNSAQQLFTSIYDTTFNYSIPFDDRLMLIGSDTLYMWNKSNNDSSYGIGEEYLMPSVKYVVNSGPQNNKVFDTITFGGRFYGGGEYYEDKKEHSTDTSALEPLLFIFKTPLKQEGRILGGKEINNRDYDFRVDVPRAGKEVKYGNDTFWKTEKWGDRLKGKFMQCELSSTSNSLDFSLQYINTKFRLSWI